MYSYRFVWAFVLLSFLSGCQSRTNNPKSEPSSPALFTDVTGRSGLHFVHDPAVDGTYFMPESIGSGGAFLDYDNDGDLDILLLNGARRGDTGPPLNSRLFRQEPASKFQDVTESSGLINTGYGMGVAVGDLDNDGDVDVYITNYQEDVLFRNNANGTFTNITKEAGITNSNWGTSAVFFDYNRDGYLDLYVATYVKFDPALTCTDRAGRQDYCGPASYRGLPDVLYRNNGNGTFTDVSVESGITASPGKGLGVVSADFNRDLYPDLYVANDQEPNFLWINKKNGKFEEQATLWGSAVNALGQAEAGMGIALGDADNDDNFDLFITHLRNETNTFYRNNGDSGFQDDTAASGLGGPSLPYTGWGTGFFDYDHDGDLDLALVNGRVTRGPLLTAHNPPSYWDHYAEPNMLFENTGDGRFRNVSEKTGKFSSEIENSRTLAFGDVDNDGDVDLLVTNEGGPARLYYNDVPKRGHWLMIRALNPALHRDAIDARVTVFASGKKWNRLINPGYSFLTTNDPRAHFGLGTANAIDKIVVQWPDGALESFPPPAVDRFVTLMKGKGKISNE